MTNAKQNEHADLTALTDMFVEDILAATNEEILSELGDTPERQQARISDSRAFLDSVVEQSGKSKLASAKEAVEADRQRPQKVISLSPAELRARFAEFVARDPELAEKMTLAARSGEELSDRDILGILQDLEELGEDQNDTDLEGR